MLEYVKYLSKSFKSHRKNMSLYRFCLTERFLSQPIMQPLVPVVVLAWHAVGAGFETFRDNILWNPGCLEETIQYKPFPNTSILTINTLTCQELKDPGILGGMVIVGVEMVSITEQITSMHLRSKLEMETNPK